MFTKNKVLKNVIIIINHEHIGLVGLNGDEKLHLLNCYCVFHLPEKGKITINGVKTTDKSFSIKKIKYISVNFDLPKKIV